ncbi:glutamate [NMDA] receptor subunit 1-like, partial [Centruroides vittatus]|uniref:glutamate [NMDA] receptor subunit 1-like n=1 Tax=Centruroides vittatus TaxID=120091 RepID=UPI0035101828
VPATFTYSETTRQVINSGFMSRLFIQIQEYLGFSYELNTSPIAERNNLLKNNNVDIVVPIVQSFERLQYMDFSQCFVIDRILFFVKKPSQLSKITAIVHPFFFQEENPENSTWSAILSEARIPDRTPSVQRSDVFVPYGQSCRILVTGWVLALYVITASYAGALMSFITYPGFESVPRAYSELLKSADKGDYAVGLEHSGVIFKFIQGATDGDAINLKRLLDSNKIENVLLNKKLITRVLNEKFAYVHYEAPIEMFLSCYGSDNFLISRDELFTINVGFGVSKSFPYKRELNEAIFRFVEGGFLKKFIKDDDREKEKTVLHPEDNSEDTHALSITDLAGSFILLIIGYIVATLTFFVELIIKACRCGNEKLFCEKY